MTRNAATRSARIWVGVRITIAFAALLLFAGLFYVLGGTEAGAGWAVGFSMLFTLPFALGAIFRFAIDPNGQRKAGIRGYITALLALAVLATISALAGEGLICIALLVGPWAMSAVIGAATISWLHHLFRKRAMLHCSALVMLPFLAFLPGWSADNPTHHFEVKRSIIIDAPAENIWPHLLTLEELGDDEGVFTIAQNVFRIPRPRSAVVAGEGIGARRLAQWGDRITFEEHVTDWREDTHLAWRFVFPNDSVARYTDAHIGPDSDYLGIETGSYTLSPMADGRTRLTLTTRYRASSPANHYAAIWGEIMLGGIQRNILVIISDRVGGG